MRELHAGGEGWCAVNNDIKWTYAVGVACMCGVCFILGMLAKVGCA